MSKHTVESLKARCLEDGDCWIWQGQFISHAPRVWDTERNTYVSVREELVGLLGTRRKNASFFGVTCRNDRCVCPDHIAQRTKTEHLQMRGKLGASGASLEIRSKRAADKMRAKVGKITMDQAREIRLADGTIKQLAAQYGIAQETVRRIRVNRTWRDHSNPFGGLMP